jgi:hypothetical protein
MKKTKPPHTGPTKSQTREKAVSEYVILRLRAEELNHLDYLLVGLAHGRITLSVDSPFSTRDLANTVRTCFLGWLATLTDKDERALYPFNCLFTLFYNRRTQIGRVQQALEVLHSKLQAFRNNVGFHARSDMAAHFQVRRGLQDEDAKLDVQNAIKEFKQLMEILISEELDVIPELPRTLEAMHLSHMPAFSRRTTKRAANPLS